ncbi:MAG: YihY/virulence factor BrkB family protein [Oligoflexus sp.]
MEKSSFDKRQKKKAAQQPRQEKPKKENLPHARTPMQFKWKDWKQIGLRVKDSFASDHISIIAAGVAFYGMLSIFPVLIAIVSIYGLFSDPATVEAQIQSMTQVIPDDVALIIGNQLRDIAVNSPTSLGLGAAISILVAIASAAKGMKAIMEGFNIAYNEDETRGMIRLQAQAMLLTLGGVLTIVIAVSLIAILPGVLAFIGLSEYAESLLLIGRWPILATLFILGLSIVHRYAPDRREAKWRWVTAGSIASTLMILLASAGFAYFAENFGNYNKTYGSIAGVIVLLLWLYLMALSLLFGAELNSEIEHQTLADSTKGKEKPMGNRDAYMADTIPNS